MLADLSSISHYEFDLTSLYCVFSGKPKERLCGNGKRSHIASALLGICLTDSQIGRDDRVEDLSLMLSG